MGNDGSIYAIPCDAPSVLKIDPSSMDLENAVTFIGDLGDMPDKYQGGFIAQDGVIYCIPENAEHVMRIHPPRSEDSATPKASSMKTHNHAIILPVSLCKSARKKFLNRLHRT